MSIHDDLLALGWTYEGHSGGDHKRYTHPEHGVFTTGLTPSDSRAAASALRDVARLMGTSMADLKARLGASHRTRDATTRKRRRGTGRSAAEIAWQQYEPKAKPKPGIPLIAQLERGTPEFRREYLQLEHDGLSPSEIRQLMDRKAA